MLPTQRGKLQYEIGASKDRHDSSFDGGVNAWGARTRKNICASPSFSGAQGPRGIDSGAAA